MRILTLLSLIIVIISCGDVRNNHSLPILGNSIYTESDTTFHTVGQFRLVNQDSAIVTNESFSDKIYIADFFFTSCPTTCPKMNTQLLRVYEKIEDSNDVSILSHTIDPDYDSVAVLKEYAFNLGVTAPVWHFVTGEKDSIYALAETYLVMADEDPDAPGGYIHSGAFLLVDKERRIRGVYDGLEPVQVDILLKDIDLLRKEYE
ncbi:MAG: SCO family protein [Cytophagales bacterium]|nr:SCO family protein [Cytophagales bacterium]